MSFRCTQRTFGQLFPICFLFSCHYQSSVVGFEHRIQLVRVCTTNWCAEFLQTGSVIMFVTHAFLCFDLSYVGLFCSTQVTSQCMNVALSGILLYHQFCFTGNNFCILSQTVSQHLVFLCKIDHFVKPRLKVRVWIFSCNATAASRAVFPSPAMQSMRCCSVWPG